MISLPNTGSLRLLLSRPSSHGQKAGEREGIDAHQPYASRFGHCIPPYAVGTSLISWARDTAVDAWYGPIHAAANFVRFFDD
jgi:hypothetical protein